ncbi:MAG: ROK family protein [Thermoguttaceae bacterium]
MRQILSLDIGGSKIMGALANISVEQNVANCTLERTEKRVLPPNCDMETLLAEIQTLFASLRLPDSFEAVGINIPGLADPKSGLWVFAPFSGIRDFPIAKIVSDYFGGKPTAIDNDVNACAYAEKLFGICRDVNDFIWITVSNGIGGGLVLGGEVFRGSSGNAGEIGHFCVVENGAICGCGNRGCLEVEAAGPAIARRYHELKLSQGQNNTEIISAAEIAEKARNGQADAIYIFDTVGSLIGRAASYAANLVNPAKIVIGGGVSGAFDLLYPAMLRTFQEHTFRAANKGVTFEKTAFGYEAALVGAAATGWGIVSDK